MKRFLLPLLAAFALPTAVNANWLSGDFVWTNSVGEKTIIKKETIKLEKFTVNDRYNLLEKDNAESLRIIDNNVNLYRRKIDSAKSRYDKCLKFNTQYYCSYILESIASYEAKIDKQKSLEEQIDNYFHVQTLLNHDWKLMRNKWFIKNTGDEVVSTTIYYTPIFEDLNGIKTVGYRRNVVCDNLFRDFSFISIYHSDKNKGLSSLERKICNKYAKF